MKRTADFEIRQYGRQELAQLYSPDITPEAAWKKLKEWIDYHPTLNGTLRQLGYQPRRQRISHRHRSAPSSRHSANPETDRTDPPSKFNPKNVKSFIFYGF